MSYYSNNRLARARSTGEIFGLGFRCLVIVGAFIASQTPVFAGDPAPDVKAREAIVSALGRFRVSYTSELNPIVINRIHSWVLRVELADGKPVEGAVIAVAGGMPIHDHGFPTNPKVTEELGDGRYRVEGMRFHMQGDWVIVVRIEAGDERDEATISLTL